MKDKILILYDNTELFQSNEYTLLDPFQTYRELAFKLGVPTKYAEISDVIAEVMEQYSPEALEADAAFTAELAAFFGVTPEVTTKSDDELAEEMLEAAVFKIVLEIKRMVGLLLRKKAPGMDVPFCDVIASAITSGEMCCYGIRIANTDTIVNLISATYTSEEYPEKHAALLNRQRNWNMM